MSKLFVILGFLCVLQAVTCRSVRDAPAPAEQPLTLSDVVKKTDDAVKNLQSQFFAFAGVSDANELNTLIQTQTKTYADQLTNTVAELTKAAENSQASGIVKDLTDKVTAQVAEWKKENPDLVQTGEKFNESVSTGLKDVTAETKKFTQQLAEQGIANNENLGNLVKQLYEGTLNFTKDLSEKVSAATIKKE